MIETLRFFASGIPKAQPRPRAFVKNFGGKMQARVYDAGTAENWKSCVAIAARPYIHRMFMEPVGVRIIFYMPRPRAHFKANGTLKPTAPYWCITKPDCDNLAKACWDALKNLGLLSDDTIIVHTELFKVYAAAGKSGADFIFFDPINHERTYIIT